MEVLAIHLRINNVSRVVNDADIEIEVDMLSQFMRSAIVIRTYCYTHIFLYKHIVIRTVQYSE